MKCFFLSKLSSESVTHQLSHTKTRSYYKPVILNFSWFVALFERLSTLVAPSSSVGFCNITAELFGKGL